MKRLIAGVTVLGCMALQSDTASFIPGFALTVLAFPIAACQRLSGHAQLLLVAGGSALLTALLVAFASALLHLRRTARLTRRLDARRAGAVVERVSLLAKHLGFAGAVQIVPDATVFAFTNGLLRPRVVLSHGLVDNLDDGQLEAVLRHELAHARRRDPLRILIARSLARALALVPAAPRSLDAYLCRLELAADRSVVREMGDVFPLASALQRTLSAPPMPDIASAAVSGLSATDVRIDQLMGLDTSPRLVGPDVNRVHATAFSFAVAAYLCVLVASAPSISEIRICIGC